MLESLVAIKPGRGRHHPDVLRQGRHQGTLKPAGGIRRRPPGDGPPPWRERVAALRYVPRLLGLVWQTHRGFTVAMIVLRLVRASYPDRHAVGRQS